MTISRWLAAASLLTACAAEAGLPAEGWPQQRRDGARSGLAAQPVPAVRVRQRWTAATTDSLSGEPAILGCTAAVVDERGVVHAFNARSGDPLWTHEREWAVNPAGVASALAFDDAGRIHAGLPADPFIVRSWRALVELQAALFSYAIDNNSYPAGPDLAPELTPIYIRSLPPNPITGAEMVDSATPSPGDYGYRQEMSGSGFHLAIWGVDGGYLDLGRSCDFGARGGAAPDWPLSAEVGGTATTLQAADGLLIHRDLAGPVSVVLVPGVGPGGVDWYSLQEGPSAVNGLHWDDWTAELWRTGRLVRTDDDGAPLWSSGTGGPARGGAALTADGRVLLARGATRVASTLMGQARVLGAAAESYAIDNNEYPPPGELRDDLVPIYLTCMPTNAFSGLPMVHSDAPSPGDYRWTVSPDRSEYVIEIWDSRGAPVLRFETGAFTEVAEDLPPSLELLDAGGVRLWIADVAADPAVDVSPAMVLGDAAAVAATSSGDVVVLELADGSERWRADAGGPVRLAPAARPGGGLLVVTDGGWIVAFSAVGDEEWSWWVGAPVVAAPVVGSDGGVLVGDLEGRLTALNADGTLRWISYLGGPTRAGLTTAPVLSDGWVFVGRSDGRLVAAVPEDTGGRPLDPDGLRATGVKGPTLAEFEWSLVAESGAPGAHWHLLRWRDSLFGRGERLLPGHPSALRSHRDEEAGGELLFYDLHAVDCGENASGPEVR